MFTGNAILKVYFAFHQSLEGHFLTQLIQKRCFKSLYHSNFASSKPDALKWKRATSNCQSMKSRFKLLMVTGYRQM